MADTSWINPLMAHAKGLFGLNPEEAAKGANYQAERAYNEARTADTTAHTKDIIPATKSHLEAQAAVAKSLAEKHAAETGGIKFKNEGAKSLQDHLANPSNWVTAPDGRRIPDVNKLNSLLAASAAAGGEAGVKNLPGIIGGYNLQHAPLSPGANLAAGGANAAAGATMLKADTLKPDETYIQKDRLTGQAILPIQPQAQPQVQAVPGRSIIPPATFRQPMGLQQSNFSGATEVQVPQGRGNILADILSKGNSQEALNALISSNPAEIDSHYDNSINGNVPESSIIVPKNGVNIAEILSPLNRGMESMVSPQPQSQPVAQGTPYTAGPSATQLQIADKKNATTITKAKADNETKAQIAEARGATAEEVARIRAGGQVDAARVRKGATGGLPGVLSGGSNGDHPGSPLVYAPVDINRLNDHVKDAMGVVTNIFSQDGRSLNSSDAAVIAAAAVKAYPGVPAAEAVNTYVTRNKMSADKPIGWGNMRILQDGKPFDVQSVRKSAFGDQGETMPPAAQQTVPAPGAPVITGGPAKTVQSPVAAGQNTSGNIPSSADNSAKPQGFTSGGVNFTSGDSKDLKFEHGEERLVYPKDKKGNVVQNEKPTAMYYNADTGKFQDEKPGNTFVGNFDIMGRNILGAYKLAIQGDTKSLSDLKQWAGSAFDQNKYDSIKGDKQKRNEYLSEVTDEALAKRRKNNLGDPRIDEFAKGNFGESGFPSKAMELAESLGINREAFGIPSAGFGENLPFGLGAVLAPAGYGSGQSAMVKNLPAFFRSVQNGTFDPRSLKMYPGNKSGVTGKNIPTSGLGSLMAGSSDMPGSTPEYKLSPHEIEIIRNSMRTGRGPDANSTEYIESEALTRSEKKKTKRGGYQDKPLKDMPSGILATPTSGSGA